MKSCSGLARLLTQIRAMMPAHSLVTNTDCPSRSQAPLAALWKDLVVGTALSRKWGPLRFGTEMTGATESCKAKSASPESQALSSGGPHSSQGDLATSAASPTALPAPASAQGSTLHTLGCHAMPWDCFPGGEGNRGHCGPPLSPCVPAWCSAPSSGNPFLPHPYQRMFLAHCVVFLFFNITRLLCQPIVWGSLCGLPSSRNFTYKSLESRKSLSPGRKLFTMFASAQTAADHRASCLVGTTATQTPGPEIGELGPLPLRSLSQKVSSWNGVRNSYWIHGVELPDLLCVTLSLQIPSMPLKQ